MQYGKTSPQVLRNIHFFFFFRPRFVSSAVAFEVSDGEKKRKLLLLWKITCLENYVIIRFDESLVTRRLQMIRTSVKA